ncbi:MAG: hypothetical protein MZV65_42305 [Chromatiales bacterium]|nr:hypothetical protein [Chromatiales bacterium]
MAQGIEDGYLAACEIGRFDLFHRQQGPQRAGERRLPRRPDPGKHLRDANDGRRSGRDDARPHYDAPSLRGPSPHARAGGRHVPRISSNNC